MRNFIRKGVEYPGTRFSAGKLLGRFNFYANDDGAETPRRKMKKIRGTFSSRTKMSRRTFGFRSAAGFFVLFAAACSLGFLSCLSQVESLPEKTPSPVWVDPVTQYPPDDPASVETAPAGQTPVETTPVETAPAEQVPVKTAPAKTAPAEQAPVKTAPAKTASAEQAPVKTTPVETAPAGQTPETPPPALDDTAVSEEVHNTTKIDIREFIKNLNEIIRRGNFKAWINCLDKSYLDKLSSREFLDTVSQSPKLKSREEPLKNLEDYFINVVIPSRANASSRVDDIDIEIITEEEKVWAFRTASNGQRQRLYELKKVDGIWKIIN
ncbi:MAG: hypothetical protein LBP20_04895 [Treponema sp.]|jgi:hypothetical protein|nr:hypothetical protein [Treponema sp.]